jgi:hypothetical protein
MPLRDDRPGAVHSSGDLAEVGVGVSEESLGAGAEIVQAGLSKTNGRGDGAGPIPRLGQKTGAPRPAHLYTTSPPSCP